MMFAMSTNSIRTTMAKNKKRYSRCSNVFKRINKYHSHPPEMSETTKSWHCTGYDSSEYYQIEYV